MEISFSYIATAASWLLRKIIKREVKNSGNMNLGKVSEQYIIKNFLEIEENLSVGDLQKYLRNYLIQNIPNKYLNNYNDELNSPKNFIINNTRISTFFAFTDGENILLFDRVKANMQTVENNYFDCYGSVNFENSSIFKKVTNYRFFSSKILKIEYIDGFAFEDDMQVDKLKYPFQTVIMFGYIIYLSSEDLRTALTKEEINTIANLDNINNINLTSKAQLAVDFLKRKKG